MAAKTRLGYEGYGVRRIVSFAGKTPGTPSRPITRLGEGGYGVRRYGSFAGKTPGIAVSRVKPVLFMANLGRMMNR